MKVCHLTSVHSRFDTRIFLKECRSLVSADYEVHLIVADGKGDETRDGVNIHDVGAARGRVDRMRNATRRIYEEAILIDADLYHFHDPELIPTGRKLKRMSKRVIFDSHEDVSKQLLVKPYLNKPALWVLSKVYRTYEMFACRGFDAIVAATPSIRDKFLAIHPQTVDINNFPMETELAAPATTGSVRSTICYVGGAAEVRGIRQVVEAMEYVQSNVRLEIVGTFSQPSLRTAVQRYAGWARVDEAGFLNRKGVREALGRAIGGIVTFLPAPNHIDSQPNKMFEYMSAGIPVIASHFPLWREIIEGNSCGVCVDPLSPKEIAQAIDALVANPEHAKAMGQSGLRAVRERFNWEMEKIKLFDLYSRLLKSDKPFSA